jgi:hypothetical protein
MLGEQQNSYGKIGLTQIKKSTTYGTTALVRHLIVWIAFPNDLIHPSSISWALRHILAKLYIWQIYYTSKVKFKSSLCMSEHHGIETYGRSWDIAPCILNLGATWSWVGSLMPRHLYPLRQSPETYWTGGSVGPRIGLGAAKRRKIEHRFLDRPARSTSLYRLNYPGSSITWLL